MASLNADEIEVWTLWKRASDAVRAQVVDEITRATGLSDPDFGVLTRVVELGGGQMRQNELAASMGYDRSRLSHHLKRMEHRGLITRHPAGNGVAIAVTDQGRSAVRAARPVHTAAVRHYLIEPLAALDRDALILALKALSTDGPAPARLD
jgi:DNA-binding MarR family transcriptional regulator